jgi:hypothetical protein
VGQLPKSGGGTLVGCVGSRATCDTFDCTDPVGSSGQHVKGPGGNSDH